MPTEADRLEALAHQLRSWGETRDLSGAMLLTRGGERVLETCVGYADRATRTPVTPATRYGIASVTKMFTACAVTSLVPDGLVAFETPVVDVLPAARRPSTLLPAVTVHHLLCHTSGIADYCEEDEDSPAYLADYADLWRDLPSYSVTRPAKFLPLFGELPPYRPPGGCFQYSNAGYIVLGLVIEELHLVRPTPTSCSSASSTRPGCRRAASSASTNRFPTWRSATGAVLPDGPWRSNVYSIPVIGGADGGAFCTARDLDRFLRNYADGTLLGPLRDVVLTPHADAGDGFGEGYGVHLYPDGRYGHGGGDPGVETLVHRWPDEDVHLVVLVNAGVGLADEVRDAVIAAWRGLA